MRLFDEFELTDARPAAHQESRFAFLNRVAGPGWAVVRDELEGWFAMYCDDADQQKANDLRQRFRNANARQHHAAWWELYVYRLLRALCPGRRIRIEPALADVSTRPDFGVCDEAGERIDLYVEAVTAFTGIVEDEGRNHALVGYVLDAINEIRSSDFWIHLDLRKVGAEQPRKREITEPVKAWLASLDRESELAIPAIERRFQSIRFRDWVIDVAPIPKSNPGLRADERRIGIGPGGGGIINDADYIKSAVLNKSRRYGQLSAPFVIAVAPTSAILRDHDVVSALLGNTQRAFDPDHPEGGELVLARDGAWSTGAEGVAGVLTGASIDPWSVARVKPILWLNPDARAAQEMCLARLTRAEFTEEGDVVVSDAVAHVADLLGLDEAWPGDLWAG